MKHYCRILLLSLLASGNLAAMRDYFYSALHSKNSFISTQRKAKQECFPDYLYSEQDEYNFLIAAVVKNNIPRLRYLLHEQKISPNIRPEGIHSLSALYLAVHKRNREAIKLLLVYKANINAYCASGAHKYALHCAVSNGDQDIIDILLNNSPDLQVVNNKNSILGNACKQYTHNRFINRREQYAHIIKKLVLWGATFTDKDERLTFPPPLQEMVYKMHRDARVKLLLLLCKAKTQANTYLLIKDVAKLVVNFAYPQSSVICVYRPPWMRQ